MELTKEVIEAAKLTPEQVAAVSEFGKGVIAREKGAVEDVWKVKANKDAEGILSGAASKVEETTKIKRNEGEKIADYLNRASSEFLSSRQSELDKAKADYEKKIKDANPDALSKAYEELKAENDRIQKKYADYDTLKEKAGKADEYGQQLSGLKLEVAFNGVKPSFPDTANKYEVAAKWDEFKKATLDKYEIELVDGQPMAISKENKYVTAKLSDLVAKSTELSELTKGRQQGGTGGKEAGLETVEGIPFQVPANATNDQISAAVKKHLLESEKLIVTSQEYAKKFAEYYSKIKNKGQKNAA